MYHLENAVSRVERALASQSLPTLTLGDLAEMTGLSSNDLVFACIALDNAGHASYDIISGLTRLAGNAYD